jgi:hypothetical protein
MKTAMRIGMAGLVAAALFGGVAPAAMAHGGGGDVVREGPCSGASDWKLKAGPDDGQLEVEFEVDQNVVGDTWRVVLKDNGTVFFRGERTTQPPSGSFEVRRFTANQAGPDRIVGRATNTSTGETCRGALTV